MTITIPLWLLIPVGAIAGVMVLILAVIGGLTLWSLRNGLY